jgi:hypothetical protein
LPEKFNLLKIHKKKVCWRYWFPLRVSVTQRAAWHKKKNFCKHCNQIFRFLTVNRCILVGSTASHSNIPFFIRLHKRYDIIIKRIRRYQQYAMIVPLLYFTYGLLHVSAVVCHHQGAYKILLEIQIGWVVYHPSDLYFK